MNKKLCHDCIYKEIAGELCAFNGYDRIMLEKRHELQFPIWFESLLKTLRKSSKREVEAALPMPCWKTDTWIHHEEYKLSKFFTTDFWYEYVSYPPDNCPFLLEHTVSR
jgi:hypothetical protein